MAERHDALVRLAHEHGPATVRHLYYRAVVERVPGIQKDDHGYQKVQRALLALRREGRIRYDLVVDSTRWMRKPTTWGSLEDALAHTAATYRRNLWLDAMRRVEVWCESDSISSTLYDVTAAWDVPLMVCRGYSSETFTYEAASEWADDDRIPVVLYVGDHDPAGLEIETTLRSSLARFSGRSELEWRRVGVTWDQVEEFDLPGDKPKKDYGFPLAVEAEALPPHHLRGLLGDAIREHVDLHDLDVLLAAEKSERELLTAMRTRTFVGAGT